MMCALGLPTYRKPRPRLGHQRRDWIVCVTGERARAFVAAAGIAPGVPVSATHFGDRPEMADRLASLVVAGSKRATTALLRSYDDEGEALPQEGDLFIVADGAGNPQCLCRMVSVEIKPFAQVGADYAADEGEGDGTLRSWREDHRAFFEREGARAGFAFNEGMDVVLQRFEVLFIPVHAADPGGGAKA